MATAFQRLVAIARLDKGWDSYGADPIDQRAIELARQFLVAHGDIEPGVRVDPLRDGGVQFSWGEGDGVGVELEIEFHADDRIAWGKWIGVENENGNPRPTFVDEGDEPFSVERCYELFCWWRDTQR